MSGKHATIRQKLDIAKHLETVISKNGDGTCFYMNGETDDTIAKQFDTSPHTVAGLRMELHGKLRYSTPNVDAKLEKLRKHLNEMCVSLGYNQMEW